MSAQTAHPNVAVQPVFKFRNVSDEVLTKRMLSCIIPVKAEDKDRILKNLKTRESSSSFSLDENEQFSMTRIFFNENNFGVLNYQNPNEVSLAIYISQKELDKSVGQLVLEWLDSIGFDVPYIPEKRDFVMVIHAGDPVHELKWLEQYYIDVINPHLMFTDDFTTLGGVDSVAFFFKSAKPYILNLRNFIRKDDNGHYHLIIEFISGLKAAESKVEIKETIEESGRILEEKFIKFMETLEKRYRK